MATTYNITTHPTNYASTKPDRFPLYNPQNMLTLHSSSTYGYFINRVYGSSTEGNIWLGGFDLSQMPDNAIITRCVLTVKARIAEYSTTLYRCQLAWYRAGAAYTGRSFTFGASAAEVVSANLTGTVTQKSHLAGLRIGVWVQRVSSAGGSTLENRIYGATVNVNYQLPMTGNAVVGGVLRETSAHGVVGGVLHELEPRKIVGGVIV